MIFIKRIGVTGRSRCYYSIIISHFIISIIAKIAKTVEAVPLISKMIPRNPKQFIVL